MKTLFLPGFSTRNRDWMETTMHDLSDLKFIPIYWDHWNTNAESMNYEDQVNKIFDQLFEPVNILAKSIGTVVASKLINIGVKTNKILLCGLPINPLPEAKPEIELALNKLDSKNVLIFQNEKDPVGSYSDVSSWITNIQKDLKVVSKPRDDHSYPYSEEFKRFLS